jgi:hypothetical protein
MYFGVHYLVYDRKQELDKIPKEYFDENYIMMYILKDCRTMQNI